MHDVKRIIDAELSHLRMTPAHKAAIAARIDRYEEGNMNRKWKLSTSLTATLAAALLLATLAYAATQSNLLARLFPHSTPTPQAEHLLTPVGRSQSQDGCKLTIDEYLLDGTTLYLHWTGGIQRRRTAAAAPRHDRGPALHAVGLWRSDTIGPAAGVLLGDEVNGKPLKRSHSGTSRINLSRLATLDKPFDVTLTALFMRPVAPIVKEADMTDRESSPTLMLMPDFVDDIGFTLLLNKFEWQDDHTWNISRPDGVGLSMTYVTGTDGNSDLYNQCWDESGNHLTAKDYELQGYASLAAEIPVTFTVIPDAANITHAGIDTPLNFSFEAFDVEVTKANFTAPALMSASSWMSSAPGNCRPGIGASRCGRTDGRCPTRWNRRRRKARIGPAAASRCPFKARHPKPPRLSSPSCPTWSRMATTRTAPSWTPTP
jgi:hypothetical protein